MKILSPTPVHRSADSFHYGIDIRLNSVIVAGDRLQFIVTFPSAPSPCMGT